mgnify:CR=1 FL=1
MHEAAILRDLLPQRPETLDGGLGVRGTHSLGGHGTHDVTSFAPDHHRLLGRSRLVRQARHALEALLYAAEVLAHDRAALFVAQDVVLVGRSLQLHEILGRRPQEFCIPPGEGPGPEEIENFAFDPDASEFHELTRRMNVNYMLMASRRPDRAQ